MRAHDTPRKKTSFVPYQTKIHQALFSEYYQQTLPATTGLAPMRGRHLLVRGWPAPLGESDIRQQYAVARLLHAGGAAYAGEPPGLFRKYNDDPARRYYHSVWHV